MTPGCSPILETAAPPGAAAAGVCTDAAGITRFDLDIVHPADRRRRWAGLLNEFYYALDLEVGRDFGRGRLEAVDVAGVRVAALDSDPMAVTRDAGHVRRHAEDYVFLPMPVGQAIALSQRGRRAAIAPGDIAFVGTAEAYSYEQPMAGAIRTLRIPAEALRARVRGIDDWTGHRFAGDGALTGMVHGYAASLCAVAARVEPGAARPLVDHLLDLLALLVGAADAASEETCVRAAHRQRALRLLEQRFRDPGFGPAAMAAELGLSERYLQKIFAQHGETAGTALRRRRLAEAQRLLERRGGSRATIAAIAYAVGFGDPAYFSRAFRAATGVAPQDYRAP